MANQLPAIKHIVQLMLENRSFDQMLGFLYAPSNRSTSNQPFEGLTGNESNPDDTGREVQVFRIDNTSAHPYLMPGADPGEGLQSTNYQLFSTDVPAAGATPTNRGFVINFKAAIASDLAKGYTDTLAGTVPSEIMGMYSPEMLPIISGLAKGFAVCDHWFASAPTMTMPNRAFASAGTSQGHMDDSTKTFTCPSIFGRLSQKNIDWAIYGYNAAPKTRLDFPDTQSAAQTHFGHFRDFQARAAAGTLPAYTFLEPSWGAGGNSQHPNYDVSLGEQLILDTYNAVRTGPGWNDTLLIITYDEHGGNYDHVAPPSGAAKPDNSSGEQGFDFTRFGVRVPAVLVSPRIAAGTVFRAKRGTIDHTSVLKTIELRWGLTALTARDKAAPDLGDVLTLATPRTDDPLEGILAPVSGTPHPDQSKPSKIEKLFASQVALLPLRNDKGSYDRHVPPELSTSAAINDYIQARTAAWTEHLARLRERHGEAALAGSPAAPSAKKESRTTAVPNRAKAVPDRKRR
jgi:phospholipase C